MNGQPNSMFTSEDFPSLPTTGNGPFKFPPLPPKRKQPKPAAPKPLNKAVVPTIPMEYLYVQSIRNDGIFVVKGVSNQTKKIALSRITSRKFGASSSNNEEKRDQLNSNLCGNQFISFLRAKCVGLWILFLSERYIVDTKTQYGMIFPQKDFSQNLAYQSVRKGLADVREKGEFDVISAHLVVARQRAQNEGLGMWSKSNSFAQKLKEADPRELLRKFKGKFLNGTVIHSEDAVKFRILLKPSMETVNVTLSGVSPFVSQVKKAKQFVDHRLHQRNVIVQVHSLISNSRTYTLYGSVFLDERREDPVVLESQNPNLMKDIAAYLLINGFAEIAPWNVGTVHNHQLYHSAAKKAKEWKINGYSTTSAASATTSTKPAAKIPLHEKTDNAKTEQK